MCRVLVNSIATCLVLFGCSGKEELAPMPDPPEVSTEIVRDITYTSALGSVRVVSNGPYVSKGFCWSKTPNPKVPTSFSRVDYKESETFEGTMDLLELTTVYYVRGFVDTGAGILYGPELMFSTKAFLDGPTDVDGNVYRAVQVGSRVWMADNLRTSHYANGDPIPYVLDNAEWSRLHSGAWSVSPHIPDFDLKYGKLYNGFAVSDPRQLCPTGWHIPTRVEMDEFSAALGGVATDIRVRDEWKNNGVVPLGTNRTGFSARPAGQRAPYFDNEFLTLSLRSSTPYNTDLAYILHLAYSSPSISIYPTSRYSGYCVRCIKD